jgi:hypothetical protein
MIHHKSSHLVLSGRLVRNVVKSKGLRVAVCEKLESFQALLLIFSLAAYTL